MPVSKFSDVFDTKDFQKRMNLYDKRTRAAASKAMAENRDDLEKRAKNLSPLDEGNLQGSIQGNPQIKFKATLIPDLEAEVHAGVSGAAARSNAWKYALRVHETMWPAIPTSGKQMQPGPITRAKGDETGPAGGKYLTRPLLARSKQYTANIAEHVRKVR